MAIVFILMALILVVSGVHGETQRVTDTLKADIGYGAGNASQFGFWIVTLLVLSALGSYRPARPVADAFIALVLIVFLLRNGGFVPKLIAAFK